MLQAFFHLPLHLLTNLRFLRVLSASKSATCCLITGLILVWSTPTWSGNKIALRHLHYADQASLFNELRWLYDMRKVYYMMIHLQLGWWNYGSPCCFIMLIELICSVIVCSVSTESFSTDNTNVEAVYLDQLSSGHAFICLYLWSFQCSLMFHVELQLPPTVPTLFSPAQGPNQFFDKISRALKLNGRKIRKEQEK